MVLRIYATPELVDRIREETKIILAHAKDTNETLQLEDVPGVEDIGRHCPLLKSCYLEAIRLYGEIRSARKVQGDFFIPTTDDSDAIPSHNLRPGDYIHALHYLHHSDPKYFPEPKNFKPERFLTYSGDGKVMGVDQGTLRPYGAGISMCKGRVVAERVILYTVAALVQTWNMHPGNGAQEWVIPDHVSAPGVCKPRQDVRVILSRRQERM